MDSFRTELIVNKQHLHLGLKDHFFTVGSCFSDAMGLRLKLFKFPTLSNPFGTTYNPISIHRQLWWALANQLPPNNSYVFNGEVNFNYHFHSQFSSLSHEGVEMQIREAIQHSSTFLKNISCLLITYGTAWVYQLKSEREIVANCHKQSSSLFEKRLITQTEIEESFASVYDLIHQQNQSVKIILTVSPVRHIKDTLPLNTVSKSILRVACHNISHQFENVEYFPAYEIMLDDLRDYRFYKQDRIHPTEEAEEYIWEKFCHSHFDEASLHFIATWKEIRSALAHKPFHPHSKKHQQFLKDLLERLEKLKLIVNTQYEIEEIQKQIV